MQQYRVSFQDRALGLFEAVLTMASNSSHNEISSNNRPANSPSGSLRYGKGRECCMFLRMLMLMPAASSR
jgi:hypothetical protein